MTKPLCLVLIILCGNAFAIDCEKAMSTPDINECARIAQEKVEKNLNIVYRRVLKQIENINKNPETEAQVDFKKTFIEAQRLWVKFREADCQNVYKFNSGGTIRGLAFISCMQSRAEQRIKELGEYEGTN
ncbi:MAG: lysozyme inhibitor LprI family protein [Shewanella sp.]